MNRSEWGKERGIWVGGRLVWYWRRELNVLDLKNLFVAEVGMNIQELIRQKETILKKTDVERKAN